MIPFKGKAACFAAWLTICPFQDGAAYCAPSQPMTRIVSLSPTTTEMLYALGLGGQVVGVSTACDRPAEVRKITKIGGMANPSLEAILALKPDVVVMTREGNPKNIALRLAKLGKRTYVFESVRLSDLPSTIRGMGGALGARESADKLAKTIDDAIKSAATSSRRNAPPAGRTALFVVWPKPLIVAGPGTLIDDAMTRSGLVNIAADTKIPYPNFSVEAVIRRRPDLILVGAAHDPDMKRQSRELLKQLGLLDAASKGRVCYVGDALYRPGPRIAEGLAEIKDCEAAP